MATGLPRTKVVNLSCADFGWIPRGCIPNFLVPLRWKTVIHEYVIIKHSF